MSWYCTLKLHTEPYRNSIAGYLYCINASTLNKQWNIVNLYWPIYLWSSCLNALLFVSSLPTDYDSCPLSFFCAADGTYLAKNCSFLSTSPSHRKLCSSIQGSMEILVTTYLVFLSHSCKTWEICTPYSITIQILVLSFVMCISLGFKMQDNAFFWEWED